ncbi:MAG: hypothetical protein DMD99_07935 [Candidatus Rokuibacteriota bacterium]|nr:MAG: hypothetical protein DMD99_07935 [Candidatus Rokubacteria bacterium]
MIVMIRYFLTSTLTIQLAHLQTLAAVARHGSFSRAARELRLTQPAVSMQVRQLERELGLPLLERVGKRTYTTKAGELLLAHAGRAMQELDRLRWDKPRTPVLDAFLATLDDLRRSLA